MPMSISRNVRNRKNVLKRLCSVLENVALLENLHIPALRRHLGAFIVEIAEIPFV